MVFTVQIVMHRERELHARATQGGAGAEIHGHMLSSVMMPMARSIAVPAARWKRLAAWLL
jgi:hypothetical protein